MLGVITNINQLYNRLTGIVTGGLDESTISLIITIVVSIMAAAFFIIRLEIRVKQLENHPFIAGLKDLNKQDAIDVYRKMRDEKGGGQRQ